VLPERVDVPDACDFYAPAVVAQLANCRIAIGTGRLQPGGQRRGMRRDLEARIGQIRAVPRDPRGGPSDVSGGRRRECSNRLVDSDLLRLVRDVRGDAVTPAQPTRG
jgi:hypothetical protein